MDDSSQTLIRFNRLMRDIDTGETSRTCFLPWEIELLVDFDANPLCDRERRRILRRYQRAAQRDIEAGAPPLKLSEYLARLRDRRNGDQRTTRRGRYSEVLAS